MRLLDISTDLGPGATLSQLEAIVKGLRVAADVAHDAETARVRRTATERMKFPTEEELRNLLDRLPEAGDETSPRYRARRLLAARRSASKDARRLPPELLFDYWYRIFGRSDDPSSQLRPGSGYDRLPIAPFPVVGLIGLDATDPVLYDALVADEIARLSPGEVGVRTLRYENPFWASLFGNGSAEETISATTKAIEVAATLGPKRAEAKADAEVAKATIGHRIAERDLDVALKREQLVEAQLRNERIALENAQRRQALSTEEQRRVLVERAYQQGQVGIADAIRALTPGEVRALSELGRQPLEIQERSEPDAQSQ